MAETRARRRTGALRRRAAAAALALWATLAATPALASGAC